MQTVNLCLKSRFLSGKEALSLQGIPDGTYISNDFADTDYMNMAGNAFSGGSCALVLLSVLQAADFSSLIEQE